MFKSKTKSGLIGVDIGDTSIKKVEISTIDGKPVITSISIAPLSKGVISDKQIEHPTELIARLKKLCSGSKNLALSVADSQVDAKTEYFNKPLLPKEVQKEAVTIAESISSFSLIELAYDYQYSKNDNALKVATYRKNSLKTLNDVVVGADLVPKVITSQSLALEMVLPYIFNTDGDDPIALFDVGYDSNTLYVSKNGKIIYTRNSSVGAVNLERLIETHYRNHTVHSALAKYQNDEAFKENVLTPFYQELSRSFQQSLQLYATSEDAFTGASSIYLTGGVTAIQDLPNALTRLEDLDAPIFIADPFSKIKISDNVDKSAIVGAETSFLTAISLALSKNGEIINFQPWRIEREAEQKRDYISTSVLCALGGGFCALAFWLVANQTSLSQLDANSRISKQISIMDEKIALLKDVPKQREDMLAQMDLVYSFDADRPIAVAILNNIVKAIPKNIYLTELKRDGATFTFVGKAQDSQSVAKFMLALKNSQWFTGEFLSSFKAPTESTVGDYKPNSNSNNTDSSTYYPEQDYGEFVVTAVLQKEFIKKDLLSQQEEVQKVQATISQVVDGNASSVNANPQVESKSNDSEYNTVVITPQKNQNVSDPRYSQNGQ